MDKRIIGIATIFGMSGSCYIKHNQKKSRLGNQTALFPSPHSSWEGVDDCNTYIVSKEKLEELLKTVNMVLKDSSLTHLLPTKSGFFFGSALYDEWYFQDLKDTKKILKKVLRETDFEKQLVVYRASW